MEEEPSTKERCAACLRKFSPADPALITGVVLGVLLFIVISAVVTHHLLNG